MSGVSAKKIKEYFGSWDVYSVLELEVGAIEQDIRKAHRKLALKYHPDKNKNDPKARENFDLITEAKDVLCDPVRKAVVDGKLRAVHADAERRNATDKDRRDFLTKLEEREKGRRDEQKAKEAAVQSAGGAKEFLTPEMKRIRMENLAYMRKIREQLHAESEIKEDYAKDEIEKLGVIHCRIGSKFIKKIAKEMGEEGTHPHVLEKIHNIIQRDVGTYKGFVALQYEDKRCEIVFSTYYLAEAASGELKFEWLYKVPTVERKITEKDLATSYVPPCFPENEEDFDPEQYLYKNFYDMENDILNTMEEVIQAS